VDFMADFLDNGKFVHGIRNKRQGEQTLRQIAKLIEEDCDGQLGKILEYNPPLVCWKIFGGLRQLEIIGNTRMQ
jgi:hypothetical protein